MIESLRTSANWKMSSDFKTAVFEVKKELSNILFRTSIQPAVCLPYVSWIKITRNSERDQNQRNKVSGVHFIYCTPVGTDCYTAHRSRGARGCWSSPLPLWSPAGRAGCWRKARGTDAPRGQTGASACPPASLGRHRPDGEHTADEIHPIDTGPGKRSRWSYINHHTHWNKINFRTPTITKTGSWIQSKYNNCKINMTTACFLSMLHVLLWQHTWGQEDCRHSVELFQRNPS